MAFLHQHHATRWSNLKNHGEKYVLDREIINPYGTFLISFIDDVHESVRDVRSHIQLNSYKYPQDNLEMTIVYSKTKDKYYCITEQISLLPFIKTIINNVTVGEATIKTKLLEYDASTSGFYRYMIDNNLTDYLNPVYARYVRFPKFCGSWNEHILSLFATNEIVEQIIDNLVKPVTEYLNPIQFFTVSLDNDSHSLVYSRDVRTLDAVIDYIRDDKKKYLTMYGCDLYDISMLCHKKILMRLNYVLDSDKWYVKYQKDNSRKDKMYEFKFDTRDLGKLYVYVDRSCFNQLFHSKRFSLIQHRAVERVKMGKIYETLAYPSLVPKE
jgi:hypothetical protein